MTPANLVPNTSPHSDHSATSPLRTSSWLNLSQSSLSPTPGKSPLGHFGNVSPSFGSGKSLEQAANKSTLLDLRNGHTAGFMFGTGNLFSPRTQSSYALDVVEAMEIDSQEDDEARSSGTSKLTALETATPPSLPVTTSPPSTFESSKKLCCDPKEEKTSKVTIADQTSPEEIKVQLLYCTL